MELFAVIPQALFLLGPPVGFIIGIARSHRFWPLAFFTFFGSTLAAINLRIVGSFADLKPVDQAVGDHSQGDPYRLAAWLICPPILIFGLKKIHQLRQQEAIEALLKEEN
ncbi:hypothetical protein [Roseibacillus persicicus]|uniref:Uncharacterized protein n=1 Tax=Roseibacillus persicicus TaxID=454148 RepID=A0A918TNI6_9BACT|nr:hypothetical protein [Roseibacillus persicicus]GHC55581.1 hypothetical protein GCM10007100_22760 [Roseibacillus persicicus]